MFKHVEFQPDAPDPPETPEDGEEPCPQCGSRNTYYVRIRDAWWTPDCDFWRCENCDCDFGGDLE